MADKKSAANDAVNPDTNAAVSSDAEHWAYQPAKGDFPADDGPHVEQVYQGVPEAKD